MHRHLMPDLIPISMCHVLELALTWVKNTEVTVKLIVESEKLNTKGQTFV